ncbi:SfnB family sulfur acquisition oxidoreductase [Acidisoma cellulosilytica]|uniref:Dibenzothiophene monooxygenase n=1 Tax=Acidisoma cellulosilyticum TaxID=2802395 RepID=A0A963Z5M0_9PROT|nr:SfnB family sulfur acquisition oxidoreductase [Acidisoma cellulosilyticum]MCB8882485.1 SfnB family sulfur acquisition oxidoreductase [Acidisoma cellulosilyticum]
MTETFVPQVAAPLPLPDVMPPLITSAAQAIAVARDFAASIRDGAAERDRSRILPIAEIERFSATGLWGITVPRDYGGPELSVATLSEVIRIVSAADPSIGQIPQNHWAFLNLLRAERDEARKQFFFQKVLEGYRFGNALVEVGTKTAADWKTTFTAEGDDFIIDGTKFYCTGALFSHFIPTVGRTESGAVLRAIVPRDTPGVTIIDDWSGFGQRTTASGTVKFDQVRVSAFNIIGLGGLREQPLVYGPISQIMQAAIDAGIAADAFEDMLDFIRRKSRPWVDSGKERASEDPLTITQVGDTRIKLRAADLVLAYAAGVIDEVLQDETVDGIARASLAVAEAKVVTTEAALHAANQLCELAGTSATLSKYNYDRHWRNARVHTLHDPVRWKYYAIGDYALNGTAPPVHSWI